MELEGGERKRMEELRIGDTIMTVDNGDLVSTEVLGFLDKRIHSTGEYLSFTLEDGKSLSISGRHIMFVHGEDNSVKSILAKDVTISDMVYVQDGIMTGMSRVVDIILEQKTGAFPSRNTPELLRKIASAINSLIDFSISPGIFS